MKTLTLSLALARVSFAALLICASTVHGRAADAFLPAASLAAVTGTTTVTEISRFPAEEPAAKASRWNQQWTISLAPLFVSETLDAASSYGMRELNPLLAGPDGAFGMKATGVKFGVVGALAGAEYLLVKKYPRAAKFFTIVNWTTAGATTGLAVHNFRLPR